MDKELGKYRDKEAHLPITRFELDFKRQETASQSERLAFVIPKVSKFRLPNFHRVRTAQKRHQVTET